MRPRKAKQLELPTRGTWGGRRAGAGRKLTRPRPSPAHRSRPEHHARHPVHATLRALPDVPSLRRDLLFAAVQRSLARSHRENFRVVQFSVQTDHLHLIVEGDSSGALRSGLQGLAIRCARAINRALGRHGPVWSHRHHTRALRTPREVRAGLVYVLLNFRKHLRAPAQVDPLSSGPWFAGWRRPPDPPAWSSPVRPARTWLAAAGWRRAGGPIDEDEQPTPRE